MENPVQEKLHERQQVTYLKESKTFKERLLSLDVMRGITIIGMIIVNTPGSWSYIYPPLRHAEWHGLTPTDMVFPFFLFMVGIAITLSLEKRKKKGADHKALITKIIKRSVIIFLLGIFLALFPAFDFANIRIPGVLQRIAVVYLFCSLIFLKMSWKGMAWLSILLLMSYWLLMVLVPVPGVGAANLEPGTNLAAWLDRVLIPGRLYQGTWDPEGLLSTMPAIATGFTGILAGYLLLSELTAEQKIIWILIAGVILCMIGYFWDLVFPVNKNLWSSSYVLVTSGLALMLLGTLYWFVDVLKYQRWTPFFVAFGMNAITAYVLHGVLIDLFIIKMGNTSLKEASYQGLVNLGLGIELASFIWAILYMLLCFIPIWIMYRKNIIVKI